MLNKEHYLSDIRRRFDGKAKELLLRQVELFYRESAPLEPKPYAVGDPVFLPKGTFLHGIFGEKENFDFTVDNGFIATDFTAEPRPNKICNSVGMWNIREDCLLKDYIRAYSGFTVTYTIGRGPEAETVSELIHYHSFDTFTERLNNDERIWTYWGDKTKEVSFLPSLVSEKRQIAFILNTESDAAKQLIRADVWNTALDEETLKPFLDYRYYPKFLDLRFHRDAATTDRESAICFGLPAWLIEGVFVGRKVENNSALMAHIHARLPHCYICGLDGTVLVAGC